MHIFTYMNIFIHSYTYAQLHSKSLLVLIPKRISAYMLTYVHTYDDTVHQPLVGMLAYIRSRVNKSFALLPNSGRNIGGRPM
jgi:hypothetical protein